MAAPPAEAIVLLRIVSPLPLSMVVCVEHGSTLGEISDTLRRVFGTHRELVDV